MTTTCVTSTRTLALLIYTAWARFTSFNAAVTRASINPVDTQSRRVGVPRCCHLSWHDIHCHGVFRVPWRVWDTAQVLTYSSWAVKMESVYGWPSHMLDLFHHLGSKVNITPSYEDRMITWNSFNGIPPVTSSLYRRTPTDIPSCPIPQKQVGIISPYCKQLNRIMK